MLIAFIRQPKILKNLGKITLFTIVFEILAPSAAYALTSGPSQPEFSSFEPVSSSNMVDPFTGEFTYNLPILEVPGPHGSGYPLSLSYHSGVSPEEEASWVGYGWTLNPGAINRNTRGFPDDYKGSSVKYHNQTEPNRTTTATLQASPIGEVFSIDLDFNASYSLRYNNYKGYGQNVGFGISLGKGVISLGLNLASDQDRTFSSDINAAIITQNITKISLSKGSKLTKKDKDLILKKWIGRTTLLSFDKLFANTKYNIINSGFDSQASTSVAFTGVSKNVSFGIQTNPTSLPIGPQIRLKGSDVTQTNKTGYSLPSYGYLYSADAYTSSDAMMDYYMEKENSYERQDIFLGIPFNNADNFVVTGEGVVGGFRVHHKQIGIFKPNKSTSETSIANLGTEFGVPAIGTAPVTGNVSVGFDLGAGSSKLVEEKWEDNYRFSSLNDNEDVDEPIFFKFTNDLASEWDIDGNDKPLKVNLSKIHTPFRDYEARLSNDALSDGQLKMGETVRGRGYIDKSSRSSRSSYISFGINNKMLSGSNFSTKAINRRKDIKDIQFDKSNDLVKDKLGEFAVYDTNGEKYLYGLPVYSRKEKNLNFRGAQPSTSQKNFITYNISNETKVGEEKDEPYATTYLLTEITTPDYIDRDNSDINGLNGPDGPDGKDYGGYTAFSYTKIHGYNTSSWYKWRIPYNGYKYLKNSVSDHRDDFASVSEGEKEIYYLQAVETKSHVAIFTISDRLDGIDAAIDAGSPTAKGSGKLKKLDKIDLYTIDQVQKVQVNNQWQWQPKTTSEKPIKTVHFQYNNSLAKGLPNNISGDVNQKGKLTLQKVWFEYNGISEAKISPYTFEYKYPTNSINNYPIKYKSGVDDVTKNSQGISYLSYGDVDQNPNYTAFDIDAWGNYQKDENSLGESRQRDMREWVNQNPEQNFDPAAWQLKVIKLPSGGEIHVQYEQHDYMYVQDDLAHTMVSIKPLAQSYDKSMNIFTLNLADVGITNPSDVEALAKLIRRLYVEKRTISSTKFGEEEPHRMYFKFLYRLMSSDAPNLECYDSEFIDGYVNIEEVIVNGNEIRLKVPTTTQGGNNVSVVWNLCKDFVKFERSGRLLGDCNKNKNTLDDKNDPIERVRNFANMVRTGIAPGSSVCRNLAPKYSYFRIPALDRKKGGGVRVKRLLTFDNSLNESVLYGSEYIYTTYDQNLGREISSGVATNEPALIREENILTKILKRKSRTRTQVLMGGRDREISEGLLGESIMPGPSIGYSRVIVKNIHSGKSNTGFTETLFFTAKDYPILSEKTEINAPPRNSKLIPMFWFISNIDESWATQSFSFIFNSMHGKMKQMTTYAGKYPTNWNKLENVSVVARQTYEYYKPGELIRVVENTGDVGFLRKPGREVDITVASKKIKEDMVDGTVEVDGGFGYANVYVPLPPFVIPIIFPTPATFGGQVTMSKSSFQTYTTSKIVRYPAILKKVTSWQDNIEHITENLAFDKNTGQAVIVKSYDEFKGAYQSNQTMAAWEYKGMGSKAINEGKVIKSSVGDLTFTLNNEGGNLYLILDGSKKCDYMLDFSEGDLVNLGASGSNKLYNLGEPDLVNNRFRLYKSSMPGSVSANSGEAINRVEVIKSGRTNQLAVKIGDVVYHSANGQFPSITNGTPTTNSFTIALQQMIADANAIEGLVTLNGVYNNMNISNYNLPSTCTITNPTNTSIKNVRVSYKKYNNGQIDLQIISFEAQCNNNNWIIIE